MPLSPPLSALLTALALGSAVPFVAAVALARGGTRRGRWALAALGVAGVYLGVSGALAASGALADVEARPPAIGLLLAALSLGTIALAFSRVGDRLLAWPLAALVGVQAFRILVEVWLSAAHRSGAVPAEITYHGHNFDLLTGLAALGLGLWLWRGSPPRGVVVVWNALGLVLLAVVVGTAALSAFGVVATDPRLTLPTTFPGVWLPAWLVQLALLGHVLVFRGLARPRGGR